MGRMSAIVESTTKASVIIQLLTGLYGLSGLSVPVAPKDSLLRSVLSLEMLVQGFELVFYLFFLVGFHLASLAQTRYFDWFITTPVMLFTMSAYFLHQEAEGKKTGEILTIEDIFLLHRSTLVEIFIWNALMLVFGLLGEVGWISIGAAFSLGTLCLLRSFYLLYSEFAQKSEQGKSLFHILFVLWSGYGIAFLFPVIPKNIGYNVLDILAKNFFGVYLAYQLQTRSSPPV